MSFFAISKQVLTLPSTMSIFGHRSALCWFSIEYILNFQTPKTKITYNTIYFIMASSSYICHKLIDDIIKRGGQEVSDRFIVRTCLDRTVLSTKKLITNEMIKQTGIKSQMCTINGELDEEEVPRAIGKDQFMYKSVGRIQRKVRNKVMEDTRNCVSNSKIRPKDKKLKTCSTFVGKSQKSIEVKKTKNSLPKELIQLEDVKVINKVNAWQEKKDDEMRVQWMKSIQDEIEEQKRVQISKEQLILRQKRAKNNFKKEMDGIASEHTYHTDGKFLVFSLKGKQRSISNAFPPTLNTLVGKQHCQARKIFKKQPQGSGQKAQRAFQPSSPKPEPQEDTTKDMNRETKQSIYNNNNGRQTTSLNFFNIKPGICYTEPSIGQSVRGERENVEEITLVKQKKSTFSKFFTKETRSKTQGFENFHHESSAKKFSLSAKTDYGQNDHIDKAALSKRHKTMRTSSSRPTDRIVNINENLREKLISQLCQS